MTEIGCSDISLSSNFESFPGPLTEMFDTALKDCILNNLRIIKNLIVQNNISIEKLARVLKANEFYLRRVLSSPKPEKIKLMYYEKLKEFASNPLKYKILNDSSPENNRQYRLPKTIIKRIKVSLKIFSILNFILRNCILNQDIPRAEKS